jgi:hypothetical protein
MTAQQNREAKARAIARALWRRQMGLADLAPLPWSVPGDRDAPSWLRFVRIAYAEVEPDGDHPDGVTLNPPSSPQSPTWRLVADKLTAMAGYATRSPGKAPPRDLTHDRPTWTQEETPCPAPAAATPAPTSSPSPAAPAASSSAGTAAAGSSSSRPAADRSGNYRGSIAVCPRCPYPVRWVITPPLPEGTPVPHLSGQELKGNPPGPDGRTRMAMCIDPDPAGAWTIDEDTLWVTPWRRASGAPRQGRPDQDRWTLHTCPKAAT